MYQKCQTSFTAKPIHPEQIIVKKLKQIKLIPLKILAQ